MDKKAFTITWKIKNFSFRWKEDHTFTLFSPVFNIKNDEQESSSAWRMLASPSAGTKYIELLIQKLSGWLTFINYEISFSDKNGISFMSIKASGATFSNLQGQLYHVPVLNETIPTLQDILVIRLKIWDCQLSNLVPDHVFAETKIEVKRGSSVWSVCNFSDLKSGESRAMLPRNASKDIMLISFYIFKEWGRAFKIRVAKLDPKTIKHCQCNFFLLDTAGGKVGCGKLDIITDGKATMPEWEISLRTTITNLFRDKTRFLPKDVLSFQCDFAFSTGAVSENIVDSEVYDDSNFTEKNSERLNTLKEDLKSLCFDPILCDTKLQTATESFPAHSAILSARSPVFRAMFTTDMKEKTKECVYIEDLDASTVRRMLLFIYSDTLEDLNWESAKNLYVASDKYDIANLRHLCANFLEQNLQLSNCCDALLLAYMHQDSKLMSLVQDFMPEHTKEILTSEEWKILEKKHPLLTSETLRLLLLKNLPI